MMPAWRPGGRLGIKTVNVFPATPRGLPALHATYTLFDAATGVPLAQLDGSEITTRRTVAASALAASYLARADATFAAGGGRRPPGARWCRRPCASCGRALQRGAGVEPPARWRAGAGARAGAAEGVRPRP
jgi:hypothetical protein